MFLLCDCFSLYLGFVSLSLPVLVLSPVSIWMAVFLSLSSPCLLSFISIFNFSLLLLLTSTYHSPSPTFTRYLLMDTFIQHLSSAGHCIEHSASWKGYRGGSVKGSQWSQKKNTTRTQSNRCCDVEVSKLGVLWELREGPPSQTKAGISNKWYS